MPRTAEQISADNAIEEAIAAKLKAYNRGEDGIMLAYVIVVERAEYKDDGDISDEHFDVLTNPMERLSTSKGLLTIGMDAIEGESD